MLWVVYLFYCCEVNKIILLEFSEVMTTTSLKNDTKHPTFTYYISFLLLL